MTRLSISAALSVPVVCGALVANAPAAAQTELKFVVKPVAEKKLKELPAGPAALGRLLRCGLPGGDDRSLL
jgi:hypothetical protein